MASTAHTARQLASELAFMLIPRWRVLDRFPVDSASPRTTYSLDAECSIDLPCGATTSPSTLADTLTLEERDPE